MADQFYRYCGTCGARFAQDLSECPFCGAHWSPSPPRSIASVKSTLEMLQDWRAQGIIASETFEALQQHVESELQAAIDTVLSPPSETAAAGPPPPVAEPAPPALPPGPDFGALFSERQADILLYLGAFLLGAAALIFVSYGEGAGGAVVRVPVLAGYTLASLASGMLVRRWDRVREAGHVFLGLGALLVPLNFVLLYTDVLKDRDVPLDAVWLYGSVLSGLLYTALAWRGFGRLYWIPAGVALLSAWSSLGSVLDLPAEWFGAWFMFLAGTVSAVAVPKWKVAAICAAVLGGFALAWSYFATLGGYPWQLPVTHAMATVSIVASAYRARFASGLFGVLLLGAGTVTTSMWALDAPPATFTYPLIASGAIALALRRVLGSRPLPWWYAAAMAASQLPAMNSDLAGEGWQGLGCFGSAALLGFLAWKNVSHGLTTTAVGNNATTRTLWGERLVYALAAAGFALAGTAFLQQQVGISEPDDGVILAALAATPAIGVALSARMRTNQALAGAIPMSAAAALTALPQDGYHLSAAAYLAFPGVTWLAAFALSRRWSLAVTGAVFMVMAAFAVRAEYEWEYWRLALTFAGAGVLLFVVLSPRREYGEPTERVNCAIMLSWGLHAAALLTVAATLLGFLSGRTETGRDLMRLVIERGDYRTLIVLVLVLAAMVGWDGWRAWGARALLPATAIGIVSGLLAIGLRNPENVQAYTAPVGLYLLVAGLVVSRSAEVIPSNLQLHEAATLLGVAFIVLPQAEQSFDPGGAWWGLVLIAEGLAFLAIGLVLSERWLVPAGTLILTGVAMRFLLESSDTVPYWLSLGLLGTALLAAGLFVLLNAEWWADARAGAVRWWRRAGPDAPGTPGPPPPRLNDEPRR